MTSTLNIDDTDPPPTAQFTTATYNASETAGTTTITVSLSSTSTMPITVDYATSGNTATADTDYGETAGTLAFAPGDSSKTFTVSIHDDSSSEGDETVDLTLSNPTNVSIGTPGTASLTIQDDEPPVVEFSLADYDADENVGVMTIEVVLSRASPVPTSVDFIISPGSALPTADYTDPNASHTLNFAAFDTKESFTANIIGRFP